MSLAFPDDVETGAMSAPEFRAFCDERPDHERWELIAGVPIMMTPPTASHNIISGNLARLLNDAARSIGRRIVAVQRSGVEITNNDYKPEPDVIVIDKGFPGDQRYFDRVYFLAETVSRSDRISVPGKASRWIDVKRDIYRSHKHCEAIVFIEQNHFDVTIETRSDGGWTVERLTDPAAIVTLPTFGLRCAVRDFYRDTPLDTDMD